MEKLFIPLELLKEFSDSNYKKLNRNVDVDVLLNVYPDMFGVVSSTQVEHYTANGNPVETHYRYFIDGIFTDKDGHSPKLHKTSMTQDLTKEQHELILEIKQDILSEDFN